MALPTLRGQRENIFTFTYLPVEGECQELGCYKSVRCKNLCKAHYMQHIRQHSGDLLCMVRMCTRKSRYRGRCHHHDREFKQTFACEEGGCTKVIYKEDLCRDHFAKNRARCVYGSCESTNIYCLDKMMCKLHYNKDYRKRRREETGTELDQSSRKKSVLLKERPRRLRLHTIPRIRRTRTKTIDIDDIYQQMKGRKPGESSDLYTLYQKPTE